MKSSTGKSYLYPEYLKRWREKNRVRLNTRQAARKRERLVENPTVERKKRRIERARQNESPEFRLRANLRRRINKALRGHAKSEDTLNLLGCGIPEFRHHLQLQFKTGMTWGNYGGAWHVDHKRPCAWFDLSDLSQQKACFHYSNLQPLFAKENQQKGARHGK